MKFNMNYLETCSKIKAQTDYYYVDYCFLEVLPPFIKEGINKCLSMMLMR